MTTPPKLRPLPEARWPVTHGQRIEELKSIRMDTRFSPQLENLNAAIRYHGCFAEDDLCSSNQTFFMAGSKVSDPETALRQQGYSIGPCKPRRRFRDVVRRAFGRHTNDSPGPTPLAPLIWVEVSYSHERSSSDYN